VRGPITLVTCLAILAACSGSSGEAGGGANGSRSPAADGGADDVEPAGDPAIRFVGRFDTREPSGPKCGWPGCRVIARFDGTAVSVKLEEILEDWMDGGPSEWDVSIDGAITTKLVMKPGVADYELATGLAAGKHVVELYKRSEAQNGVTRFLGYDLHGGTLLAPPRAAERRIEIVGDSQPAAFGIEGVGQGPDCPGNDWAARWQNFHKSFGARLGETFRADVFGTVYSGKGFARNIWRPDDETMPKIFGRANPVDPTSVFDLKSAVPDVVVVMMGGNDFAVGQPADDGPAPLDEFIAAFDGLVGTMRDAYPQAHLYLAVSPSVSDEQPPGRKSRTNLKTAVTTIADRRTNAGDARVHAVEPPVAQESELTACDGHGSPEFHDRLARDLATVIRSHTGW
jgi:hypothetical protein